MSHQLLHYIHQGKEIPEALLRHVDDAIIDAIIQKDSVLHYQQLPKEILYNNEVLARRMIVSPGLALQMVRDIVVRNACDSLLTQPDFFYDAMQTEIKVFSFIPNFILEAPLPWFQHLVQHSAKPQLFLYCAQLPVWNINDVPTFMKLISEASTSNLLTTASCIYKCLQNIAECHPVARTLVHEHFAPTIEKMQSPQIAISNYDMSLADEICSMGKSWQYAWLQYTMTLKNTDNKKLKI